MSSTIPVILTNHGTLAFDYVTGATNSANQNSYTFSAQSLGTADSARIVIVGVASRQGTAGITISSLTVAGVSASQLVSNVGTPDSSITAIWAAAVPTGTTGDVVVTFSSGTQVSCHIGIWRMLRSSSTAFDTGGGIGNNPSDTINIPAGGAACAVAYSAGASPTTTWTGLTERFDNVVDTQTGTGASSSFSTTQTGLTVQATFTSNGFEAMSVASWGPG